MKKWKGRARIAEWPRWWPVIIVAAYLLIAFCPRVHVLSLGEGERAVVFTPASNHWIDGSAAADLIAELEPVYGAQDVRVERGRRVVQGKMATVYDLTNYDLEYAGAPLGGGAYVRCTAVTLRTAVFDGESWETALSSVRTAVCFGFDDGDWSSVTRASVLWPSLQESYSDSAERFAALFPQ